MYDYDYYDLGYSNTTEIGVWGIIALVVAIIGGICLYFTVFSDNKDGKYTGFLAKLYDFVKFKKMFIAAFLKISYLIVAIFITLYSFELIAVSFLAFILCLVLGNIIIRFIYEFSLVLLGIFENTSEINKKLKK